MKKTVKKDLNLLTKVIKNIKTQKNLKNFLDDLLTEEEILDLAQRIKVAQLILAGKTYEKITKEIEVSTATISKIGQAIKYGRGGYRKTLEISRKEH